MKILKKKIELNDFLSFIEEANRELELFKKFQIAAQANPKLTYVEFCKTINNE